MIQKIINGMAVVSFAFSTAIIVGGVVLYSNRYEVVEIITEQAAEAVAEIIPDLITESLGGLGGDKVPDAPVPPNLPF